MTVSEQIIQVLNALCEKFGIVIDWTSENVIPYISSLCAKLVAWEVWTSVAWMAIMVVLCIISVIATKLLYPIFKKGIENEGRYEVGWTIGSTLAIIGLSALYLLTFIVICVQAMDIIKCVTFPEMYVFEYVQGLISAAK